MKLYLVLDARTDFNKLLTQVKQAINGGIDLIQLANATLYSKEEIKVLIDISKTNNVKFIIYNDLDFALENNCDGVHLDFIPKDLDKKKLPSNFMIGVTVSNDTKAIEKSVDWGVDYISFCSLYPTTSATACEIVDEKNIKDTIQKYDVDIYVAGGIKEKHLDKIKKWNIAGIAMISTILEADDIQEKVKEIKEILK